MDGDEVVGVIAVVLTIIEVMTVTSVLEPSEEADGVGIVEIFEAVLLLPALEVRLGTEDTGPVSELQTEEAEPELLA